jgi:hypothetical protein
MRIDMTVMDRSRPAGATDLSLAPAEFSALPADLPIHPVKFSLTGFPTRLIFSPTIAHDGRSITEVDRLCAPVMAHRGFFSGCGAGY